MANIKKEEFTQENNKLGFDYSDYRCDSCNSRGIPDSEFHGQSHTGRRSE